MTEAPAIDMDVCCKIESEESGFCGPWSDLFYSCEDASFPAELLLDCLEHDSGPVINHWSNTSPRQCGLSTHGEPYCTISCTMDPLEKLFPFHGLSNTSAISQTPSPQDDSCQTEIRHACHFAPDTCTTVSQRLESASTWAHEVQDMSISNSQNDVLADAAASALPTGSTASMCRATDGVRCSSVEGYEGLLFVKPGEPVIVHEHSPMIEGQPRPNLPLWGCAAPAASSMPAHQAPASSDGHKRKAVQQQQQQQYLCHNSQILHKAGPCSTKGQLPLQHALPPVTAMAAGAAAFPPCSLNDFPGALVQQQTFSRPRRRHAAKTRPAAAASLGQSAGQHMACSTDVSTDTTPLKAPPSGTAPRHHPKAPPLKTPPSGTVSPALESAGGSSMGALERSRLAQRRYREKHKIALMRLMAVDAERSDLIHSLVRETRMAQEHRKVLMKRIQALEGIVPHAASGSGHTTGASGAAGLCAAPAVPTTADNTKKQLKKHVTVLVL